MQRNGNGQSPKANGSPVNGPVTKRSPIEVTPPQLHWVERAKEKERDVSTWLVNLLGMNESGEQNAPSNNTPAASPARPIPRPVNGNHTTPHASPSIRSNGTPGTIKSLGGTPAQAYTPPIYATPSNSSKGRISPPKLLTPHASPKHQNGNGETKHLNGREEVSNMTIILEKINSLQEKTKDSLLPLFKLIFIVMENVNSILMNNNPKSKIEEQLLDYLILMINQHNYANKEFAGSIIKGAQSKFPNDFKEVKDGEGLIKAILAKIKTQFPYQHEFEYTKEFLLEYVVNIKSGLDAKIIVNNRSGLETQTIRRQIRMLDSFKSTIAVGAREIFNSFKPREEFLVNEDAYTFLEFLFSNYYKDAFKQASDLETALKRQQVLKHALKETQKEQQEKQMQDVFGSIMAQAVAPSLAPAQPATIDPFDIASLINSIPTPAESEKKEVAVQIAETTQPLQAAPEPEKTSAQPQLTVSTQPAQILEPQQTATQVQTAEIKQPAPLSPKAEIKATPTVTTLEPITVGESKETKSSQPAEPAKPIQPIVAEQESKEPTISVHDLLMQLYGDILNLLLKARKLKDSKIDSLLIKLQKETISEDELKEEISTLAKESDRQLLSAILQSTILRNRIGELGENNMETKISLPEFDLSKNPDLDRYLNWLTSAEVAITLLDLNASELQIKQNKAKPGAEAPKILDPKTPVAAAGRRPSTASNNGQDEDAASEEKESSQLRVRTRSSSGSEEKDTDTESSVDRVVASPSSAKSDSLNVSREPSPTHANQNQQAGRGSSIPQATEPSSWLAESKQPLLPQQPAVNKWSWQRKLAIAGAVTFGGLAVASFFVPIFGIPLAYLFGKIAAACATTAAGITAGIAATTAITGATVGVGTALGAGLGRVVDTKCNCMPTTRLVRARTEQRKSLLKRRTNNAKMHQDLGSSSGPMSINRDFDADPSAVSQTTSQAPYSPPRVSDVTPHHPDENEDDARLTFTPVQSSQLGS